MSKDQRPLYTISDHQELFRQHGDRIYDEMRAAFDAIMAQPGKPEELINDALSIMSELAAAAGVLFLAKLMEAKKADPMAIWATGVVDIQNRMVRGIGQFGEWMEATRQ